MDTVPNDTAPAAAPATVAERAARLAAYIEQLQGFDFRSPIEPYGHMGATITDVALQARWNYQRVVRPRARHVRDRYSAAATTTGFLQLLNQKGPHSVLRTRSSKVLTARYLAALLARREIETEAQLRKWIVQPGSRERLLRIKGVGPKTADYLALRVGVTDVVAVDSRLRAFLREAEVATDGYDDTVAVVVGAAKILGITPAVLDASIWRYAGRR